MMLFLLYTCRSSDQSTELDNDNDISSGEDDNIEEMNQMVEVRKTYM